MTYFLSVLVLCFFQFKALAQFDLDEFESGLSGGIEEESAASSDQFQEAEDDSDIERIQVTGSHLKRVDAEGISPVMSIDRSMMERSGYNSVSDVLRDISANSFGSFREQSGSAAAGAATVSLRGMGANKTLVLLNGKRLPVDVFLGAVDLNLIPMAAVERIEILKDGASATYGSDALGGVVNIITYRDYHGTEVSYNKSFTKYRGGETEDVNLITGTATARSSIVTVLSYRNNTGIFDRDRGFSAGGESLIGSPGSYKPDGQPWRADANCSPGDIRSLGDNEFCSYNFSQESMGLPDLRQLSGMTTFEYETDHDITVFGRVGVTNKRVNWQYAPAPGIFEGAIPGGGTGDIRYRTVELGNRVSEDESTAVGYQVGLRGDLGAKWDWEVTMDRNRVRYVSFGRSGYALESNLNDLISNGDFNPFAAPGQREINPGSLATAEYVPWQDAVAHNTMYEAKITGELMEMGGGVAGVALGVAMNEENFINRVDPLSERGEVFSSGGSSGQGGRTSRSAFIETILPLMKGLDVQLAARHDRFDDFGNTTNPKVGVKFQPLKELMFRASAGTGFMAPSLRDLYAAQSFGFPTFVDEVACANERAQGVANAPSCRPAQYRVQSGGNENLQEEKSKSVNLGVVFEPSRNFMTSLDVWQTNLDNVVGIDYQDVTRAEMMGLNLSQYGVSVARDDQGYIDLLTAPLQNLSRQEIRGFDLQFNLNIADFLRITYDYSHILHFRQEGFPGAGFMDMTEERNGYPDWRSSLNFQFALSDNHGLGILLRTIGTHKKSVPQEGDIPRYTEVDLTYNWRLAASTNVTLGIQNVTFSRPPLDNTNLNNQLNQELYNNRGPLAFVGIKQGF